MSTYECLSVLHVLICISPSSLKSAQEYLEGKYNDQIHQAKFFRLHCWFKANTQLAGLSVPTVAAVSKSPLWEHQGFLLVRVLTDFPNKTFSAMFITCLCVACLGLGKPSWRTDLLPFSCPHEKSQASPENLSTIDTVVPFLLLTTQYHSPRD